MPRGFKNGQLVGRAKRAKETRDPSPLPVPGPGRDIAYPRETYDSILTELEEGQPLTSICSRKDRPSLSSFYRYLEKNPAFRERYHLARMLQAQTWADRAAQDAMNASTRDQAVCARVQADVLLKLASLYDPTKFTPKQNAAGAIEVTINTSLNLPQTQDVDGRYVIEVPQDESHAGQEHGTARKALDSRPGETRKRLASKAKRPE